ncbi:MAG: deoxyguanosinetriphosphate triphosphohydrolase family protein [Lachnospiraceae bacterium]|jgi:dGTPase
MNKPFENVAAREGHPAWEQLISRQSRIYSRTGDIRTPFGRDYTRVLHCLAFRRLRHKTQVFFNAGDNDHVCTRIEHVLHVDSVSSTIAGYLGLNSELTKAISMAHDLGHAPFGHLGERILNEITQEYLGESFWHEKNGLRMVDKVELLEDNEMKLRNLNLTYAVRDGIISHCGEVDTNHLKPREDYFDLKDFAGPAAVEACTWEGCLVKLADKIAYLGRDIEDARRLGYLSDSQMEEIAQIGRSSKNEAVNTTVIINNTINDLCANSSPETGLCFSREAFERITAIKRFNYDNIYRNPEVMKEDWARNVLNGIFSELYKLYDGKGTLNRLREKRNLPGFVQEFAGWVVKYTDNPRMDNCINEKIYGSLETEREYIQAIVDYIAGMTDIYAQKVHEEIEC